MVHLTLTIALSHAISFLTKPLIPSVAAKTIDILRQQLELKLREEFESTWFPDQPQRGSNQRSLTLSPGRLPPRALLAACFSARFPWSHWMELLGKVEFTVFIDPGSVSVLRRGEKLHRIVWSSSTHSGAYDARRDDEEIDEVLDIINRKVIVSDAWLSPTQSTFPQTQQQSQPAPARLDTAFLRSRCVSRLSNSSGSDDGAYDSDAFSTPPSLVGTASLSSVSSRASSPMPSSTPSSTRSSAKYVPPARRGVAPSNAASSRSDPSTRSSPKRTSSGSTEGGLLLIPSPREEKVVVDASKAKLTVYAGKTTVMSGGVMLSAMARRA